MVEITDRVKINRNNMDRFVFITNYSSNFEILYTGVKRDDQRVGDITHSKADISKAREKLRYDPKWSFERGIAETVDWYSQDVYVAI